MRPANEEVVLKDLDALMAGHGNGKQAAAHLDVDPDYLRSIRSGARRVPLKVARGLGYELRWVKMETTIPVESK
jgi:hypothetical protein